MFVLVWTICMKGMCETKPIERNLMLDECITKSQTIDGVYGSLTCQDQQDTHWRPYTLHYESNNADAVSESK